MASLSGHTLTSLLMAALLFNGCKEPTSFAKAGPLFAVAERSSPAQAPSMAQKQINLQTDFDLESPMTRIVRVPPAVLQQLAAHHDVRAFLDARSGSEAEVLGAFEAAPAHINTDEAEDLVVRNSRLNGANIGPFWLFKRTAQGYDLVLFTRSLGISILKPVAGGYHDVKASSATAVALFETRYRFDRRAYQPKECTRTDLSTNRTVRVECGKAR